MYTHIKLRQNISTKIIIAEYEYKLDNVRLCLSTSFESIFTSSRMELIGRLRSRPLVNGTMQKLHMLSQPLIIDLKGLKLSYHDNTSE